MGDITYITEENIDNDLTGCYEHEVGVAGNEYCPICSGKLSLLGRKIRFNHASAIVEMTCQNCRSTIEHEYWLEDIKVLRDGRFRKE